MTEDVMTRKRFEITYGFTIVEWRTYEVEADTEEDAEALIEHAINYGDPGEFEIEARPMDCLGWDHLDTKEIEEARREHAEADSDTWIPQEA